ncbi:MAG: DUF4469 domain-containing protein [Fusobacteriaceae bacterium]
MDGKLEYFLRETYITEEANVFIAHPYNIRIYNLEQTVDRMIQRGTSMTKTDIIAVINLLIEEINIIVKEGGAVNLPLFRMIYSIVGKFNSAVDTFDNGRHKLKIKLVTGEVIDNSVAQVELIKVQAPVSVPNILQVIDSETESINDIITSSGILTLRGANMKMIGDDPSNGVWLLDSQGVEYKHTKIVSNSPSELIITIAAVPAGTYELYVTTQYTAGSVLKRPRIGYFPKFLKVL